MTDKKFTQKDIINALEICSSDVYNDSKERCTGCKYDGAKDELFCFERLDKDALALINRLKTRIVRYQLKNTNQRNALASLNKKVAEQKAEIENLQADKEALIAGQETLQKCIVEKTAEIEELKEENKKYREICEKAIKTYKETKSEAIKEFAERLKKAIPHFDGDTTMECVDGAISIVIDEMTEGKE